VNPYRHEFQHLLRRKAVIAVVIVAALAGSVGYVAIDLTAGSVTLAGSGFWYYDDGTYHLEIWAFDVAGNPVSGVRLNLEVLAEAEYNGTPAYNSTVVPPLVLEQNETSDAQGRLQFQFSLPPPLANTYDMASFAASYAPFPTASFDGALEAEFSLSNQTAGNASWISGPTTEVAENYYSGFDQLLVLLAGPNGSLPTGDSVVACNLPFSFGGPYYDEPSSDNCTGAPTQLLGSLSGYETFLPMPPLPANPPEAYVQVLVIENASGDTLYSTTLVGPCFGPDSCSPLTSSSPGPGLLNSFAADLALFLPLMGLMLAYWSYARPRLSGTVEPVLARPVTRRGLFLTRYAAMAFALLIAVVAEVLVLDAGLAWILREPLPASFLAPLIGGLAVAAIGFAGIIFLLAHVFRSTGPVLGVGITLLLLFSLFWL
jgi:ABC-2 type transport system permease protein